MDIFSLQIFNDFSPFSFISQHITVGYLCSLTLIYIVFLLIWKRVSSTGLILAIFPFTPLFTYFFYASSNISMLFFLGKYYLGLLWLFCIFITFWITTVLLSKIKSLSKSSSLTNTGVTLYSISKSTLCFSIFFVILFISLYLSYSGGIVEGLNHPDRVLSSFSGGITKYINDVFLKSYLFIYVGTLLLTSKKLNTKKLLIFCIYLAYSIIIRFFTGSKGFILGFIFLFSLIIYRFNLIKKILTSLKRGQLNYNLLIVATIIAVMIIVFITGPLSKLFLYLVEYQFVAPVECTTVVIKESIDPEKAIGANYFLLLLEPLHKFNIGINQYSAGNSINLASTYLTDSKYGGTNPSVFCQSTSQHYSTVFIPFFWSIFSSFFIASSSFLCKFINKLTSMSDTLKKISPTNNNGNIFYQSLTIAKKQNYSSLACAFITLLIYSLGTPQRSWVEWILKAIFKSVGISFWILLFNSLRTKKKPSLKL